MSKFDSPRFVAREPNLGLDFGQVAFSIRGFQANDPNVAPNAPVKPMPKVDPLPERAPARQPAPQPRPSETPMTKPVPGHCPHRRGKSCD